MRFGKSQKQQLRATWHNCSWFYQNLGEPARRIIQVAYGLTPSKASHQTKCQEDVSLALELFAGEIGATKSQVVHALLTGSFGKLICAITRDGSTQISGDKLVECWAESFRAISLGKVDVKDFVDE